MSRPSCRLLATTRTRAPTLLRTIRPFSQTCARPAGSLLSRINQSSQQQQQQQQTPRGPPRGMDDIGRMLTSDVLGRAQSRSPQDTILAGASYAADWGAGAADGENLVEKQLRELGPPTEPFHFHVYAHKHNCHITVTKPNRGAILSMSTGQIGFRKSKRGSYDAAYQLTAYAMDKLNQGGWHKVIKSMEVVLRGFGSGREAATKILLGAEGKMIRDSIVMVADATRLKFGGTRSPKPRRLG